MDAPALRERGFVYTFYSFKGGVGRSMALANVAALLSSWGKKVLVVDWDLEAPGIEKYFGRWLEGQRNRTPGLVELITSSVGGPALDWRQCLLQVRIPKGEPIAILHAGLEDGDYNERLRAIDWERMFGTHGFGLTLEHWRDQWTEQYDFVLVDSRTGITDIGGICTIHLPDVMVSLFTTNEQSLVGVKDVMLRARRGHARLPLQRKRLIIVPTPARDESSSEFQLAAQWRARFAAELDEFYADWIPKDETALRVLDLLKIPYLPYWSFGERLPVLEEDIDNPKTLSYSYQLLARLILSRLDLRELTGGRLAAEALAAQRDASEQRAREAEAAREKALRDAAQREQERAEAFERQRRAEAQRLLDTLWAPAIERQHVLGLLALTVGAAFLLAGLAGVVFPYGEGQGPIPAAMNIVYAVWRALGAETQQYKLLWWLGVCGYLGAGGALAYWGRRRLRDAGRAVRERALYDERSLEYRDLGADDGLRLLLFHTQNLLDSRLGAQVAPAPRAELAPPPAARPAEPGALAAPLPAGPVAPASTAEPVDVYISYRHSTITRQWLDEFLPLFSAWLSESLGREAVVYRDEADAKLNADWHERLRTVSGQARCFLALLTPTYFSYDFSRSEWDAATASPSQAIVPILFQGELTQLPIEVQAMALHDLREFAFIGEGFTRSERYVEFQSRVKRLAEEIARRIGPVQRSS